MVHGEGTRQRESFSRRRLDFAQVSSSVYGKTFYLDLRKPMLKEKVIKCVRHLGGKIEDFLSKEVNLLITDRPVSVSSQRESTPGSENPTSPHCLPLNSPDVPLSQKPVGSSSLFASGDTKPLTRTQTLLLKAQQNARNKTSITGSSEFSSTSTTIQNAITMGIKVISAQSFLTSYQEETKRCKVDKNYQYKDDPELSAPGRSTRATSKLQIDAKENQPCVKVEDFSRKYKPLYKTFDRLPEISYELGLNSRTSNSKKRQKTTPRTVSATPKDSRVGTRSVPRPSTVKGQKHNQKGGYCESCDYWFSGRVREHIAGSRHQQFAKNIENYQTLDAVISKLPGLDVFLSSVNDGENVRSKTSKINDNFDVEMKEGNISDTKKFSLDCSTEKDIPEAASQNLEPIAIVPKKDLHKGSEVIETDDTPVTLPGQPKVLRKLLAKCSLAETSEAQMSVDSKTDLSRMEENDGDDVDGDILNMAKSVNANISNFEEDDNFGKLEPPCLERIDTNFCRTSVPCSAPVLEPCVNLQPKTNNSVIGKVERKKSPRKRLNFGIHEETSSTQNSPMESTLGPSGLPRPFMFGQNDSIQSPSELLMRFVQASALSKDVDDQDVPGKKRRRSRDTSQSVYYATKTSDMRLKLCRVSDRTNTTRSSKDLKSYWKVKKTGDCKLVFSPKYSKKSKSKHRSNRNFDISNQENLPIIESDEPCGKRVKIS